MEERGGGGKDVSHGSIHTLQSGGVISFTEG